MSSKSAKHQFLSLIALKDRGGLFYPSENVLKILNLSERVFKQFVSGSYPKEFQINNSRN